MSRLSAASDRNDDLRKLVRTIPDFPRQGVQFRDLTTLFLDPAGFRASVERLVESVTVPVDLVAAIDARGFAIGGAVAERLGAGLLLIRKDGKLPGETIREPYTLEYGKDALTLHEGSVPTGAQVLLVDDLIATGGTTGAAVKLIERAGGRLVGARFLIDLPALGGTNRLRELGVESWSLMEFDGD